jgi:beta-lactam-binding protein with PASTA domain
MLLAIGLLAAAAAILAALLLTRDHRKSAQTQPTTAVVTSAPATTATTAPAKKLTLPVPDLVGTQGKAAAAGLRRSGFHVSVATVPSALPPGTVTAQDPPAGKRLAKGSDVRLNLSNGSKSSTQTTQQQQTTNTAPTTTAAAGAAQVPSLNGDLRPALDQLVQAGFAASLAYVPNEQPLGTVVAQSPAAGQSATRGSHVTLNLSAGPHPAGQASVPNVVGRRIPKAVSTLNGSGLRLVLLRTTVSDKSQAGMVVSQTPEPGKQAPKNAQILVYMGAYSAP